MACLLGLNDQYIRRMETGDDAARPLPVPSVAIAADARRDLIIHGFRAEDEGPEVGLDIPRLSM